MKQHPDNKVQGKGTGKSFHLGSILGVTTGGYLPPEEMGGVFNVMNYVTGADLTHVGILQHHELVRIELLDQFPWLAEITCPPECEELSAKDSYDIRAEFVRAMVAKHGQHHTVKPLREKVRHGAEEDHKFFNHIKGGGALTIPIDINRLGKEDGGISGP